MLMLVYWEPMVRRIIANRVVYVKYKNEYKVKLMGLNCLVFPVSPSVLAMIHVYGTADKGVGVGWGENVICHCACIAAHH